MSGAGKLPLKQAEANGSAKPDKDQQSPAKEDNKKTLKQVYDNQLVPQPRYTFPERDETEELVQRSAPAQLETCIYRQDMVRGEDGLMYPLVPYKSLRQRLWQEEREARQKALEQPPPSPPKSTSSSETPPSRDPSSGSELQFEMDL